MTTGSLGDVPMRVAFLAPDVDLSSLTGDAFHVKALATALARSGCRVDLVVARDDGEKMSADVRVHILTEPRVFRAALYLVRQFAQERPDVIYERRMTPKLGAILGFLLDRPYFVEVNGVPEDEAEMLGERDPMPAWVRQVRKTVRGFLLRHAVGIATVTCGLKVVLQREYGISERRIRVIPNGVDTKLFHPIAKDLARATLEISPQSQTILFVGNLAPWQGIHTLVKAMPHVRREFPDARLVIVGDGVERTRLQSIAGELCPDGAVHFEGSVPHDQVPIWIGASDVCVMPSTVRRNAKIGSSALKLREYLACGRPVVATDIEGAGPFLEEHRVGFASRGDDAEDLATRIISLLQNPDLMLSMGERARGLAIREMSWDLTANRLRQLYGTAIKG